MNLCLLGGGQFPDKFLVLLLVQGTVDVVGSTPVIAGLPPGQTHINGFGRDQRGRRIEEMQILVFTEVLCDGIGHGIRGQRTGGNDDRALGNLGHFLGNNGDVGMVPDLLSDHPGETAPVNSQTAAGFHAGCFGTLHDQAAHPAQLFLQQAHGIFQPVAPKRVGAHQLRKIAGMVGGAFLNRAHFVKLYFQAPVCQLPCSFGTGQACADDFYFHLASSFFFLVVVFFVAGFLAAVFFAAVFLGAAFLAAVFLVVFFSSLGASSALSEVSFFL